jgi:hypothetical protein
VFQPSNITSTHRVLSILNSGNSRLALFADGHFEYTDGTTTQSSTPSPAITANQRYLITIKRTGNVFTHRVLSTDRTYNGASISGFSNTKTTYSNLKIPTFATPQLALGGASSNSFGGAIYEFAMFRYAITDQVIQQIEGYMAWKWGLQSSLPATHAYKLIMP